MPDPTFERPSVPPPKWEAFADKCIGYGILLAVFGAFWLFVDHLPFSDERTVYLGYCTTQRVADVCSAKEESANPTTYRATAGDTHVVYWVNGTAPRSYGKCAVRDAGNWSCQIDESYEVGLVDGKLFERTSVYANPFCQVPKWRWYWLWVHTKSS